MIQHIHHGSASPKNLPGGSLVSGAAGCDMSRRKRERSAENRGRLVRNGTRGPNGRKKKPPPLTHKIVWLGGEQSRELGTGSAWLDRGFSIFPIWARSDLCPWANGLPKNTLQAIPF